MHHGAIDFLEKPFKAKQLLTALRKALKQYNSCKKFDAHGLIGNSKQMQAVYQIIDSVASSKY